MSGVHASSGDWRFCHAWDGDVVFTYQNGSLGSVCHGRSVTYPYGSGYYVSGSEICCDDKVSLMGQSCWGSLDQNGQIITVIALHLRAVVTNVAFPSANETIVTIGHHVHHGGNN